MFTRSEMAGFFFCLASGTVQGFYFALLQYSRTQAFTAAFITSMQLYSKRRKTAHRALQERFRLFTLFCRRCVAGASAYTAPAATRWSVSQRRSASSAYQIPAPRRTPYRSAQPQTMQARRSQLVPSLDRWQVLTHCQQYRPCAPAEGSASPPVQGQPGGVSMLPIPGGLRSDTGSAVRKHRLAPYTRLGSPAEEARRAARNNWRLSPQLFSGFRPIANKGEQ